jgi:anti-sigma factor RsiW
LLDGALDDGAAQAARAHLAACAGCARRLEVQARLFAEIESWEEAAPPQDLGPRVLAALRTPAVPVGLRWAAALQAAWFYLRGLGWPFSPACATPPSPGHAASSRLIQVWLAGVAFTTALKTSLLTLLGQLRSGCGRCRMGYDLACPGRCCGVVALVGTRSYCPGRRGARRRSTRV